MYRPANVSFLERYGLTELVKEEGIDLADSGYSLTLTKEQIEKILADGYFSALSIADPDAPIEIPM